jgi:two-component system chemotaxis response regulator CheB
MTPSHQRRDIVVIGASAGGVDALSELVAGLPPDLPAAVFIVLHIAAGFPSRLPDVLARRGRLLATHPVHGEKIVPGRIYVAPADNQMMLRPGCVHVVRGPKENGHRPAVDALFRTAAKTYGPRVVGVVLTGYLDCGTAGLLSIKARGGVSIVQDPRDAAVPDMPQSAIAHVTVDHVTPLRGIPDLIARLVQEPAGSWPATLPPGLAELEGDELGVAAELVCPLCQGKITGSELNGFQMFRCHVGHAFSLASVAAEQADSVERALWAAVRALDEAAALTQRCAARASGDLAQRYDEKARLQAENAQVIRGILLDAAYTLPPPVD